MLITINVKIPTQVTDSQRALFEQLAGSLGPATMEKHETSFFDRMREALGL